jgi:hypothetical protein
MHLTIVQPDLAKGTIELMDIVWRRGAKTANRSLVAMVAFGTFFLWFGLIHTPRSIISVTGEIIHPSGWGFPENTGCVFLGIAAFFLYARFFQKRKHLAKVKEITDQMRMGLNECTITITDHELHYSSSDYHVEIKWSSFRSYYEEKTWVVVESNYALFGMDTRFISAEQKNELIAFLNFTIRKQGTLFQQ